MICVNAKKMSSSVSYFSIIFFVCLWLSMYLLPCAIYPAGEAVGNNSIYSIHAIFMGKTFSHSRARAHARVTRALHSSHPLRATLDRVHNSSACYFCLYLLLNYRCVCTALSPDIISRTGSDDSCSKEIKKVCVS